MPRDIAIIVGDLIGKLDVLRVECPKCDRLAALIDGAGRSLTPL